MDAAAAARSFTLTPQRDVSDDQDRQFSSDGPASTDPQAAATDGSAELPQPPAAGPSPDDVVEVTPASLMGMAASFATSMARFAASGFQIVERDVHSVRVAQCDKCEYHEGTRCKLCGCFIDKKAWLPHEDCPIGRWPV